MELKIGFLSSGELGYKVIQNLSQSFMPHFIFTDSNSTSISSFAQMHSIPIFIGNPRKFEPQRFLNSFETDIIFSINYLFIVENNILSHPRFAINLHGSLLPKYRGRTPHVWAIINGEKQTGVTAHFMEKGCDTGDIVLQQIIEIEEEDTGATVLSKFVDIYPKMIAEIIEKIKTNKLNRIKQDITEATYFEKRTPDDGEINWNWQKERIKNWIRAQAHPYPGAFSYLNGKKVKIDKVSFTDFGFESTTSNGTIIKTTPGIIVKTPNGAIELTGVRNREQIQFELYQKFENSCK